MLYNELNISDTAVVMAIIGAVIGVIISIVLCKRKTRNERFIQKCKNEGTSTTAVVVKTISFIGNRGDNARNGSEKFILKWKYTVAGKTYKKTTFEQATDWRGYHDNYRTIYYKKSNPRKAQFANASSPVLGCLTGIIFWIIVIFGAIKLFP